MKKTIIVDGKRFTLARGKKYHYNTTLRKTLHQYLWESENGKLPKGHEIHHKDFNTLNNSLDNLQLVTIKEHKKIHLDALTDEQREKRRQSILKNAMPKAIEWHSSKKGREWHKSHYENTKDKLHQKKELICECCEKIFWGVNNGKNRFCSNKCKSKWRRDNGLDDEIRVCAVCNNEFSTNKYYKSKTCSRKCGIKLRGKNNANSNK